MARNKYTFFAQRAKQENHPEIAALFDSLATNEPCTANCSIRS